MHMSLELRVSDNQAGIQVEHKTGTKFKCAVVYEVLCDLGLLILIHENTIDGAVAIDQWLWQRVLGKSIKVRLGVRPRIIS